MPSRLSDRLLATGLVPPAGVRAAVARQAVYGGALDTALLELDAHRRGDALGRARGGDRARDPGSRALRGAAEAGEARRLGRARPRRSLVGALPGGAGGAQGRRAADPVRRAGRARRDRGGDARAGHPVRALRRAGDLDRAPSSRRSTAGRWSRGSCASSRGWSAPQPVRRWQAAHTPRAATDPAGAAGRDPAAPAAADSSGDTPRRARAGDRFRVRAARPSPPSVPSPSPVPSPPPAPLDKRDVPGLIERLEAGGATPRRRTPRWWRSPSRTSGQSRSAGPPGGSSTRTTSGSTGCSRGSRTRPPRSGRPPSRSCARSPASTSATPSISRARRARRPAPAGRPGGPTGDRKPSG